MSQCLTLVGPGFTVIRGSSKKARRKAGEKMKIKGVPKFNGEPRDIFKGRQGDGG